MLYTLNIGDQRSTALNTRGGIVKEVDITLYALLLGLELAVVSKTCGAQVVPMYHFDAQEGTYVCMLKAEPASVAAALDALACVLDQEAIAYASIGSRGALRNGALVGPLAAQWGAFDPAQFRLPNGRTALDAGVCTDVYA